MSYDHYKTSQTFAWEKYPESYRMIHPAYCLMCKYMFADENDRRVHIEAKHHACSYCYLADTSLEHVIKSHPYTCIPVIC
jgi:hypothetical protein